MTWCFHDRLREFTFTDGTKIKMCPDCTGFDAHRRMVLFETGQPLFPIEEQTQHWESILADEGLSYLSGSSNEWLEYQGCPLNLRAFEQKPTYIPKDPLYDFEWEERIKPFPHSMSMPRKLIYFCPHCTSKVVDEAGKLVTFRRGFYLTKEHDCSMRVYDLQGMLLEVKEQ